MSVSLSKGQRVDLTKGRPSLKSILVGLRWDINHYDGEADFDLDASVFMTKENGKVGKDEDFIFYGNLEHSSKSVKHGIIVNMLDGAQKAEITEDMLTDEQKDDLECGLITMDDIRAEYGKDVYGDRIRELQFVKPARGFTKGSNETAYSVEDLEIPERVCQD